MVIHLETHTAAAANPTAGLCSQSVNTAGAPIRNNVVDHLTGVFDRHMPKPHQREKCNRRVPRNTKVDCFEKFCRGNLGEKFPM